jgi:thiazole synthase ThiGH ThiG subunit
LLVNLCRSHRIKVQLLDDGLEEIVDQIVQLCQGQLSANTAAAKDYKEALDWANMAKDALNNNEISLA